eukprot:tig00001024_g6320.t1
MSATSAAGPPQPPLRDRTSSAPAGPKSAASASEDGYGSSSEDTEQREAELAGALARGVARGVVRGAVRILPKAAMGAAEEVCAFPFEVARTKLQTDSRVGNSFEAIRDVVRHEGWRCLFRGVTVPIFTGILQSTVLFGAYGTAHEALGGDRESALVNAAAGGAAGAASAFITSPSELLVRRMHHEGHESVWECLRRTLRTKGFRDLYRGFALTAARDVGGYASFFCVYEELKRRTHAGGEGTPVNIAGVVLSAGTASAAYSISTYPIDVVKTNVQLKPDLYRGASDCIRRLHNLYGWRVFFRGLPSTAMHAFPANALGFLCYELVAQMLGETGAKTNPHAHHW